MTEAEKQALAIYETICATSHNRPSFGTDAPVVDGRIDLGRLRAAVTDWREKNPGMAALRRTGPEVVLAFLNHAYEWLQAEPGVNRNLCVWPAVCDAIQLALTRAPKPLPADLVCRLLQEYRQGWGSMAHLYFPFEYLLGLITRNQVTDDIRSELRKLHLHFAPSPTGKIEESVLRVRNRIAELVREEGEAQLDPGRGPWSQIVFNEIKTKDEINRLGWEALLEHFRNLEQTAPGAKWNKRARELVGVLGEAEVTSDLLRWLALGPTPGQLPAARSPIEDSAYQKGAVWCLGLSGTRDAAVTIGDFGIVCLRKIPMLGAVSQKVGFACVRALGAMECSEAVAQLTRLRAKVKYWVARRLIEESLQQAAERSYLSVEDLEDISVGNYGLDVTGAIEIELGDAKAITRLREDGKVNVVWRNADGKPVKSTPSHIKKAFAKEVRSASSRAKELEQAYLAQRIRLEESFLLSREMPLAHWQQHYIEHSLLGFLGRRLIWVFRGDEGWECSGMWSQGEVRDASGDEIDLSAARKVRLWHPLTSDPSEIQRWRERVFTSGTRQPFRQAFREFYQITDEERKTRMHSNRFAGILMRQHQLASLCRARGWKYGLMGADFDGGNVPVRKVPRWNMHVEFYVDLPSDRDKSLRESALGEQSGSGINLFVSSDQVRFYRDQREVPVDEVPVIAYSEIMRDVDLFTSVCAVGGDETWSDQGERGIGIYSDRFVMADFSALTALRVELLSRVLPHTRIADRCKVEKNSLSVRGQLGSYHIPIGWSGAALVTESEMRELRIPQKILDAVSLDDLADLPVELDYRAEMALRRAYLLADDWKIDAPELVRQLMPE